MLSRLILCFILLSSLSYSQSSLNMTLRANWDDQTQTYNDIWGYAANGREYAILGSRSNTIFLDITQPDTPVEVTRFVGGFTNSIWRDFKTYGHYAYGVADRSSATNRSGLQVFDLSGLPNTVTKVYDSYEHFDRAHNLFIDTATAKMYVAGARDSTWSQSSDSYNGVMIFDLSQSPDTPALLSSTRLQGGYIHDLYVRNDTVYCAHIYNGVLGIYDLRNPAVPVVLANFTSYPGQGYTHSMWLRDQKDILVFADETHGSPLKALDVSDLSNLSLTSIFSSALEAPGATNSIAHNPIFRGDSVYISYYHDGIQVFDLSNPAFPQRAAYYDTRANSNYNGYSGCWGVYPLLPSGLIIGSDISTGLYVLEMLNPPLANDQLQLELSKVGGGLRLRASRLDATAEGTLILERKEAQWEHIADYEMKSGEESFDFFEANPPAGKLAYRLRLEIPDGQHLISNEVAFTQEVKERFFLLKNPMAQGETIELTLPQAATVSLFDMQGKKMSARHYQAGAQKLSLNLQPGVYLLQVDGEAGGWEYVMVL